MNEATPPSPETPVTPAPEAPATPTVEQSPTVPGGEQGQAPGQEQTAVGFDAEKAEVDKDAATLVDDRTKNATKPEESKPADDAEKPKDGEEEAEKDEKKDEIDYSGVKSLNLDVMPEEYVGGLVDWAKERGLSANVAQDLVELGQRHEQAKIDFWEGQKKLMRQQVLDDPELGKEKIDETRGLTNQLVLDFCRDDTQLAGMRNIFNLLGLGDNIHFVRFMTDIAKATRNDTIERPGGPGGANEKDHRRMFPNSTMNP